MRALLVCTMVLGAAAFAHAADPIDGQIRCTVEGEAGRVVWEIRLDASAGSVRVAGVELAAAFSPSHVRWQAEAGVVTIGRHSGRLVQTGADGRVLGYGICLRGVQG